MSLENAVDDARNNTEQAEIDINNYLKFFGKSRGLRVSLIVSFHKFYHTSIVEDAINNLIKKKEIAEEKKEFISEKGHVYEHVFYTPVYGSLLGRLTSLFSIPRRELWF